MFYWLFTDGRAILGSLVTPLLCLTLLMPLVVAGLDLAYHLRQAVIEVEHILGGHALHRLAVAVTHAVVGVGAQHVSGGVGEGDEAVGRVVGIGLEHLAACRDLRQVAVGVVGVAT